MSIYSFSDTTFSILLQKDDPSALAEWWQEHPTAPIVLEYFLLASRHDHAPLFLLLWRSPRGYYLWSEVLQQMWSSSGSSCQAALLKDSFFHEWLENEENCRWVHSLAPKEFLQSLHLFSSAENWDGWRQIILSRSFFDLARELMMKETSSHNVNQWLLACVKCRCRPLFLPIVRKLQEERKKVYLDFLAFSDDKDAEDICWLLQNALDNDIHPISKEEIVAVIDELVLHEDNPDGLLEDILSHCQEECSAVTVWDFLRDEFLSASFLLNLVKLGFNIVVRNEKGEDISAYLYAPEDLRELVAAGIVFYLGDNDEGFNPADVSSEDGRFDLACELIRQGCANKSRKEERTFLYNILQCDERILKLALVAMNDRTFGAKEA